jgi:hypothetical protein
MFLTHLTPCGTSMFTAVGIGCFFVSTRWRTAKATWVLFRRSSGIEERLAFFDNLLCDPTCQEAQELLKVLLYPLMHVSPYVVQNREQWKERSLEIVVDTEEELRQERIGRVAEDAAHTSHHIES